MDVAGSVSLHVASLSLRLIQISFVTDYLHFFIVSFLEFFFY